MAGYIGSKASVTQVDGYNRTEADSEFVQVAGDTMTGDLTITGTLDVDNVTDGTTSVPTGYVVNGSGKMWVRADNAAVPAESLNVASGVDDGTGTYTYNFTSSFSNSDYSAIADCRTLSTGASTANAQTTNTTNVTIRCYRIAINEAADRINMVTIHGDLA